MRSTILGSWLATLLSLVAWQPFARSDFDLWKADDGEYHLLRIYVFEAAVRGGEWLPRWTPDLFVGYGYPLFHYYAPGTYYLALLLRLLGLDVYTAVQALGVIAAGAGAGGAYCFARAVFGGQAAGLIAALAFVYAPYPFITNLLIRADLPEALGLGMLPWTLLAAWRAGRFRTRATVVQLALAMGAVVMTHNLTALVALPAAGAVGVFGAARSGRGQQLAGARAALGGLALALALTAFFWVPALVEQRYVQIEVALQGGHKSAQSWLINPLGATEQTRRAGNPQTVFGPLDLHAAYPYDLNYPPKPSLAQGALSVATLALVARAFIRPALKITRRRFLAPRSPCFVGGPPRAEESGSGMPKGAVEAAFFCAGTLLLWGGTTTWSAWVWEHLPLMRFLQFSWRLYGPLALCLALATAGATALAFGRSNAGPGLSADMNSATRTQSWRVVAAGARSRPGALAAVPLLLTVCLVANTTTARPLWLNHEVERRVGGSQLVGTENATFGAGTTTGGEFVPRTVDLDAGDGGRRRGNGVFERLYPEFGWLAGRVQALEGQLRLSALSGGPTWTDAHISAETAGVLAFHTVAFPGWRAYLDGQEATAQLAPTDPELAVSPGFLTMRIPAGEHHVQIAFGPTRLRNVAAVASVLSLAWLSWSATTRWRGQLVISRTRRQLRLALPLAPAAFFAGACMHDAARPLLGAPVIPRAADNRLIADLAQLTQQRQATINSPSGSDLGPFVNLQHLIVKNRERRWLYMHPPSSLSVSLALPQRAAFQAGLALDPRTWTAEGTDGVRFILDITLEDGSTTRAFEEHVHPRAREEQRDWLDRWVDLSAYGGRQVTLTLRTEPGQTAEYDWAGWADPVVIVQKDARRPGGGPPGPLPTPRAS